MKKKFSNQIGEVNLDLTKIISIQAQLSKGTYVRVGVLGSKAHNRKQAVDAKGGGRRPGKAAADQTNAEIGFIQEFGSFSKRIPARSWLRMPLYDHLQKEAVKHAKVFFNGLTSDNFIVAYKKLGVLAENIIQRAFASRGYGKWAPNAPMTIRKKKSSQPLIDTAQLRRAITSKVEAA